MQSTQPMFRAATAQRGSSLIEVLVALLVASLGMLGVAAMHARALQLGTDAADRNRAALLASELASSMWLQRSTLVSAQELQAWKTRVANAAVSGLPNATATVSDPDPDGMVTITIQWRSNRQAAGNGSHRYATQVVLP
ncbi:MAG: type pilus modification protein PilV [Pseudomonadota bacterium]